ELATGLLLLSLQSSAAAPAAPAAPSPTPAAGATAAPSPAATPAPTPPPPSIAEPVGPRITFTLPFPPEKGGGEASGSARSVEYQREDFAVLTGGVKLHYKNVDLSAQEVSVDLGTKDLTAL